MQTQGKPTNVAVCGDSITRGQVSSDYVAVLTRDLRSSGHTFTNHGINGDLAYNVLQRLDGIIGTQPDVLTLLVGTNDVNSQFDEKWKRRYIKDQKLPKAPDLDWYAENVNTILSRVTAETNARIAVVEILILGEDLTSRMNRLVNEYNATLHQLAQQHGVPCLALNARLREKLPNNHQPPPYEGSVSTVAKAGMRHMLLRRTWDNISHRNGLALLTDHIHLNDTAAAIVSKLIADFVQGRLPHALHTSDSTTTAKPGAKP